MPLISVIVTVYNLEKYIAECLDSLANQQDADFEVIVVDNGSTDNSVAICRSYAEKYPARIRLITLGEPSEMHRGHKAGIEAARGEYLHIIDGDDYVRNGYLKEVTERIRERSVDVIIGHFAGFTEGNALPYKDVSLERKKIDDCPAYQVISYIGTMPAYHLAFWRYIFKRSIINGGSLFHSHIPENGRFPLLDALVTFRILLSASSFSLIEKPIYYYRSRGDSVSVPNNKQTLWHIQSFTEFMLFLHQGEFTGVQRAFVLAKLRQSLRLALGQSDLWDQETKVAAAALLEKTRMGLCALSGQDLTESLLRFRNWMEQQTPVTSDAIADYFAAERKSIMDKACSKQPDRIYIFPGGQFARQVQRWMIQSGFHDVAFLDNNRSMAGRIIQGSPCYTLADAKPLLANEEERVLVMISTIYEELDMQLHRQCREEGVSAERILIS